LLVTGLCLAVTAAVATAAPIAPPQGDLGPFQLTYYWFAPESDAVGVPVAAPGVVGSYREDFLYAAWGVAMQGPGTALTGATVHWAGDDGAGAWVNAAGQVTSPTSRGWTHGAPFWRNGGWRNHAGAVTFRRADGTWSNGPGAGARLPYHDQFAAGAGAAVTVWHSIATDPRVIPTGTAVWIPALAQTPAGGCFVADDTGGAIIGQHVDVLVPAHASLPASSGDVVTLAAGAPCPPAPAGPPAVFPKIIGQVGIVYAPLVRERAFHARPVMAAGMRRPLREDFLYAPTGVAAGRIGIAARFTQRVVLLGGGFWVNARGRRTDPLPGGGYTNGAPVWREGGWRSSKGRPTWLLGTGRWSHGRGVRFLAYHERFGLVGQATRQPWQTLGVPAGLAPLGSMVRIDALPSLGCVQVSYVLAGTAASVQLVVPEGTNTASLPTAGNATAYAPGDVARCAG
jgi:3D domain